MTVCNAFVPLCPCNDATTGWILAVGIHLGIHRGVGSVFGVFATRTCKSQAKCTWCCTLAMVAGGGKLQAAGAACINHERTRGVPVPYHTLASAALE